MTITTRQTQALDTALKALYLLGKNSIKPHYPSFCTLLSPSSTMVTYEHLADLPDAKRLLNDEQLAQFSKYHFVRQNCTPDCSIIINPDVLEEDDLTELSGEVKVLGRKDTVFPDSLVFDMLCKGFSEEGFDGRPFFDNSHAVEGGYSCNIVGDDLQSEEPWFLLDSSYDLRPLIVKPEGHGQLLALQDMACADALHQESFMFAADSRFDVGYGLWQLAVGSRTALDAPALKQAYNRLSENTEIPPSSACLVVGQNNERRAKHLLANASPSLRNITLIVMK